jgi:hypothetical protein
VEKLNPDFYPAPMLRTVELRDGLKNLTPMTDGFMTRVEFVRLYDVCGELLHARNPFSTKSATTHGLGPGFLLKPAAFIANSAILFWILIKFWQSEWKRATFWVALGTLAVGHTIASIAILALISGVSLMLYTLVTIAEVAVFDRLLRAFVHSRR